MLSKYDKAWAAALSQAVVQMAAAFVELDPAMEQSVGVILTSLIVMLVPNKA